MNYFTAHFFKSNDIDVTDNILDWNKCWRIFAYNVMELYWIEMVVSMITNVAKIGENCDFEYAFSIGSVVRSSNPLLWTCQGRCRQSFPFG